MCFRPSWQLSLRFFNFHRFLVSGSLRNAAYSIVPDHDGGWPKQISAWFLYTHITEFRLLTTSFRSLLLYTTGIFHQSNHSNMYTRIRVTIYIYTWRIPLAFNLPLPLPLSSPLYPLLLTWNPPSCDRNRPPRSQVACKLTLPCPTLHPPLLLQIPRTPTDPAPH